MWSPLLSRVHFVGWRVIIVAAAITLPLGISTSKEYAELSVYRYRYCLGAGCLPALTVIGSIFQRRERHLYVAIWFYLATWLGITMLQLVHWPCRLPSLNLIAFLPGNRMPWCNGGMAITL